MEKQLLMIRDTENLDIIAALLVETSLDIENLQKEVEKIIHSLERERKGEWLICDVLEGLPFDYEEIPFESLYM